MAVPINVLTLYLYIYIVFSLYIYDQFINNNSIFRSTSHLVNIDS